MPHAAARSTSASAAAGSSFVSSPSARLEERGHLAGVERRLRPIDERERSRVVRVADERLFAGGDAAVEVPGIDGERGGLEMQRDLRGAAAGNLVTVDRAAWHVGQQNRLRALRVGVGRVERLRLGQELVGSDVMKSRGYLSQFVRQRFGIRIPAIGLFLDAAVHDPHDLDVDAGTARIRRLGRRLVAGRRPGRALGRAVRRDPSRLNRRVPTV